MFVIILLHNFIYKFAEVNIDAHRINDGATYITCKSNYQDNTYDLIGPSGQIDINCFGDNECETTLQEPQTGEYYCVLALDGIPIFSSSILINSTEDEIPPTQPIIIAAQIPILKITISVGVVGAVLLIIAIIVIIGLSYKIRRNGYQQVPNDDPGKIQLDRQISHYTLYLFYHNSTSTVKRYFYACE